MNNDKHLSESEITALEQGGLPADATRRVRRQLARQSRLVRQDIRKLLQRSGTDMPRIERAPVLLRSRLRAIPGPAGGNLITPLRLCLSASIAAVVMALVLVMYRPTQNTAPSRAEIEQARADLVIAFTYLRRISSRSDYYMRHEIGHTMQNALSDSIFGNTKNEPKGG